MKSSGAPCTLLALLLAIAMGPGTATAQDAPNGDSEAAPARLLPAGTVAYLHAHDWTEMSRSLRATAWSRLTRQPQVDEFYRAFEVRLLAYLFPDPILGGSSPAGTARISPSELLKRVLALQVGELTFALVDRGGEHPAWVLIAESEAEVPLYDDLLRWHLETAAAVQHPGSSPEQPPITRVENAKGGTLALSRFEKLLLLSDEAALIAEVARIHRGRAAAKPVSASPEVTALRARMADTPGGAHLEWYLNLGYLVPYLGRQLLGVELHPNAARAFAFDSLGAMLGQATFCRDGFDVLLEARLALPGPRRGLSRLVALKRGGTDAQRWVPKEAVGYSTLLWDRRATLDQLAELLPGNPRAMRQLARDQEILGNVHLEGISELTDARYTHVTLMNGTGPRAEVGSIAAVRLRGRAEAEASLRRLTERTDAAFHRRVHNGSVYFEAGAVSAAHAPCIMLQDRSLLVADRADSLHRAIDARQDPESRLSEQLDYKLIASKVRRLSGGGGAGMFRFFRTEEYLGALYRLVTGDARHVLDEAAVDNPLLDALLKTLKRQEPPPFYAIAPFLAPGGDCLLDDGDALHYRFFLLGRK